ncbi:MAG: TonB-dependent receptor plug domain-containing protein, partial [Gemmatimonadaceae bacterium]
MLLGSSLAAAQQPTPRDTTARPRIVPAQLPASPLDTLLRRDSTGAIRDTSAIDSATARRRRLAADTIKSPLAHAERPVLTDARWQWAGEALRSTGAVTLADLLERIPGATSFRANWIPAPQYIAYNGDAGRVRVFLDGVELDAIDARNRGLLDLVAMPLWQIEDVTVERAAGELRVHLRSWRVERTTPMTRTDITSGSEGTNLYRGYFGKRLHNGGAIQLAAQQYSTVSPRTGGDGSSLQVFGRLGWSRKNWSVDATWNRVSIDRSVTTRFPQYAGLTVADAVPTFKGALSNAYARVAWGDPDAKAAPWAQLIAATQSIAENHKESSVTGLTSPTAVADTVDSTAARVQYVLAAGISRWGVRASVGARLRLVNLTHREAPIVQTRHVSASFDTTYTTDTLDLAVGETRMDLSPSVRLSYTRGWLALSAYGETRGADSTQRVDAGVRLTPWRWLEFSGSFGSYTPKSSATGGPAFTASRAEVATTLWGRRLSGGVITRGLTTVAAPTALDSSLIRVTSGAENGFVAGIRGPIYRDLGIDISAVQWAAAGAYRPQREV